MFRCSRLRGAACVRACTRLVQLHGNNDLGSGLCRSLVLPVVTGAPEKVSFNSKRKSCTQVLETGKCGLRSLRLFHHGNTKGALSEATAGQVVSALISSLGAQKHCSCIVYSDILGSISDIRTR